MSIESSDQELISIEEAVARLLSIEGFNDLIPQVGSNLVYAKENATTTKDIAALSGRIISTIRGPLACGVIEYGASKYLASVLLSATKHDDKIRAAMNICARDAVTMKLEEIGLKVAVIPGKVEDEGCPVTHFIEKNVELLDVYVHPGDFGIEPTTTIIGSNPETLLDIIRKLV